jgi:hypothetical protein
MKNNREEIIDFFRGLAILDMILVHFLIYFPNPIRKIISYTDVAIEGFILLFGFMIGGHYYAKYLKDKKEVIKRLFHRIIQILIIQYIFIITINLPAYYLINESFKKNDSIGIFVLKSTIFWNQIGIIHILPTFIPFLMISPLIHFVFKKNLINILIILSIVLFIVGNKYPYLLNYGDKTIFPVILWQIYFVLGCWLGYYAHIYKRLTPKNLKTYLYISIMFLCTMMLVKHAKYISPLLTSKFPLNTLGFLYGSSILLFIYVITIKFWENIIRPSILKSIICLFGRQSLFIFVLHVYTAYCIVFINKYYQNDKFNLVMAASSVIFIYFIAGIKEKFVLEKNKFNRLQKTV